jgi:uncharacterized protein (TIGR02145 family)
MRFTIIIVLTCFLNSACTSSEKEVDTDTKQATVYREVEPSQVYDTCRIGDQTWMAQNLNEPHFKNGDPIPQAKTPEEWKKAGNTCQPAWCYYNNDQKLGEKFGKLYNWYAVKDPRGLAPKGWSLPSDKDWIRLYQYVTKQDYDGLALQHKSFVGNYPDADTLHFHAYGAGYRKESATFSNMGKFASFWSKDTIDNYSANALHLNNKVFSIQMGKYYRSGGFSVRCLKN